ncbi:hypothetical protein ACFLX5_01955 [Chloroflexota bacterium]
MPKIIPITEKRGWLQRFESGESEAYIARNDRRNIRTVKKGIEEARNERDIQLARSEILRDALRRHQDQLMANVRDILSAIEPTQSNIQLKDVENRPEHELLIEHLGKRDQIWSSLQKWKDTVTRQTQLLKNLESHIETLLMLKTGYLIKKESMERRRSLGADTSAPVLYPAAVRVIYDEVLGRLPKTRGEKPFKDLIKVIIHPTIIHESVGALAQAPGEEEKCMQSILTVFDEVKSSIQLENIHKNRRERQDIATKLKKELQQIVLLGVVTGRCQICRRLGM